jgi:hypothetical protein
MTMADQYQHVTPRFFPYKEAKSTVLLRVVEAQPALGIVEDLGKRAQVERGTRQGIVGAQQEGRIVVTGGHAQ